jgi:CO/xanthine dehydrogenase Mo-binding subunit
VPIGQRLKRLEDPPLLLGRGRYVADLVPPDALHAAIVRSPYAHARVLAVDGDAAREADGVVAVITAADLPDWLIPGRFLPSTPGIETALQPPLARDRVRYVGEPVAVVVASTRYEAEDALGLLGVDYDVLPPVLDVDAAVADDAEQLFDVFGTNAVCRIPSGRGVDEDAFAQAALVVEETLEIGRHFAVPMETRGLLAAYDPRRGLVVHGPTKSVHFTRRAIAEFVGMEEHDVHVVEPNVGGAFGLRGELYPEDVLVPWLAVHLERPIVWIEDRREHMLSANHSREQRHRARVATDGDGRLLALEDRLLNDQGAYLRNNGIATAELTTALMQGPYRFPKFLGEVTCVMTNRTPTDVYRAPGRYEGTFVRERLMDILAHRLDVDPEEFRRRNLITPEEMPYDTGVDMHGQIVYDNGNYPRLLDLAVEAFDYERMRALQREERGSSRLGIGIGFFVEKAGLGPWEYSRVEITPSGRVLVYTGLSAVGQGMVTTLAQLAADELGVDESSVDVVYGVTDRVPYGIGTFASRGAVVGGTAVLGAIGKVKDKMRGLAALELEAAEDDIEFVDGGAQVRGVPASRLSLGELAAAALPGKSLPDGIEPGLGAGEAWIPDHMTYSGGVVICSVRVDVETGIVDVGDFVCSYDIGRAINPMLVEGQLEGGIVQGIGGALLEELRFDDEGQPLCTSFMDYLLPSSTNAPASVRIILDESTPSSLTPNGSKGAGEAGIAGAGAAVANAVSDALGAEVARVPISPADVRRLVAAG